MVGDWLNGIPPPPGTVSLIITVPASVPSLFQGSIPWRPSSAKKNSVPPTLVSRVGAEEYKPGWMSLTRWVPACVPSVIHSSHPKPMRSAVKNALPPTGVRSFNT